MIATPNTHNALRAHTLARAQAGAQSLEHGHAAALLRTENAKTSKGESLGWLTAILYLAPQLEAAEDTGMNACIHASAGCAAACLYTAGRGRMSNVQSARYAKTVRFAENPEKFVDDLRRDVARMFVAGRRAGFQVCVRLNGTSDFPWEKIPGTDGLTCLDAFPGVQFYDYTKDPRRAIAFGKGKMPANYHLTFSRSENNEQHALRVLRAGGNVAVVFSSRKGEDLPATWKRFRVLDGDVHDLRFLDDNTRGRVIGLRAKGEAKHDTTGFVVHVA